MVTVVDEFLNTSLEYMMSLTATAQVTEQKMEPIGKAPETRPIVITGQALYDSFMVSNEGDLTRMGLIRQLVDTADALQIKGACDKMVELARDKDYPEGKPKKADRRSKEQQAMNVRTIIQQGWGALHFARAECEANGYDDSTGYLAMRVIAQKALADARIDWKGDALKTDADKERAKLVRAQREETTALVDVQKANPRLIGEDLTTWNERVFALAQTAMEQAIYKAEDKAVEDLFVKLLEKHGEARLQNLARRIVEKFDILDEMIDEAYAPAFEKSEEGEEEFAEQVEPTEQEALNAMAAVSDEQAAGLQEELQAALVSA